MTAGLCVSSKSDRFPLFVCLCLLIYKKKSALGKTCFSLLWSIGSSYKAETRWSSNKVVLYITSVAGVLDVSRNKVELHHKPLFYIYIRYKHHQKVIDGIIKSVKDMMLST